MKKFVCLLIVSQLIIVNPAYANTDLITIDMTQAPLSSKLKKEYQAYKYNIMNTSKQNINLVNAQIVNGQDGAVASSAMDDGNGVGTLWAIAGPVGLFTFGIGWAVGLLATPVVLLTSKGKNKKARLEGQAYSNIVDLGWLGTGESIAVQTLVPIGAKPQLKLTFQDPNSKELLMVSR